MNPLNLEIAFANLATGVLAIVLAAPFLFARNGQKRPFRRYADNANQLAQNIYRFWGQKLSGWAIALVAIGAMTMFVPLGNEPTLAMAMAIAPLLLLIPCVEAFRLSRILASDNNPRLKMQAG